MECLLFSVPVQCLFSQHGLPFTPFFLFLTSPNSYLIATTLDLRKTEKNVKTFRSNPVQKTQLNKEKDERKAERAGKKSKAQHRSRSGLWHRKGMQFIWTLKKNLVLSKINFPLKKKIYKKVCLFLLSVVLQWTWNIPSRERWKKWTFRSILGIKLKNVILHNNPNYAITENYFLTQCH